MRWALGKLSALLGTILAAVSGAAASQTVAFIQAYLQRLGGHIDEARRTLESLRAGEMAALAGDAATRGHLMAAVQTRLDRLETAQAAIEAAGVAAKPFVFAAHIDREIATATARAFTPALPLDPASLVFALAGIVLGWAVWELVSASASLLRRGRRPSKTARRAPPRGDGRGRC